MKKNFGFIFFSLCLFLSSSAYAQFSAENLHAKTSSLSVEAEYEKALESLILGKTLEAQAKFKKVYFISPQARVGQYSLQFLRYLQAKQAHEYFNEEEGLVRVDHTLDKQVPSTNPTGKVELAVGQTLFGIWTGGAIASIADPYEQDSQIVVSFMALGGITGLSLGLGIGEKHAITTGQAMAVNYAETWGFANGALALAYFDPNSERVFFTTLLGGSVVGLFSGIGIASRYEPYPGQVAMTVSGAVWSSALTALMMGVINPQFEYSQQVYASAYFASLNIGTLVFSQMAKLKPMSRARVRIMDVSGILGGLTGAAIGYVTKDGINSQNVEDRYFLSTITLGTVIGLASGIYLTEDYDVGSNENSASMLPFISKGVNATDPYVIGMQGSF